MKNLGKITSNLTIAMLLGGSLFASNIHGSFDSDNENENGYKSRLTKNVPSVGRVGQLPVLVGEFNESMGCVKERLVGIKRRIHETDEHVNNVSRKIEKVEENTKHSFGVLDSRLEEEVGARKELKSFVVTLLEEEVGARKALESFVVTLSKKEADEISAVHSRLDQHCKLIAELQKGLRGEIADRKAAVRQFWAADKQLRDLLKDLKSSICNLNEKEQAHYNSNLELIERNHCEFTKFANKQKLIDDAQNAFNQGVSGKIQKAVLKLRKELEGEIDKNYNSLIDVIDYECAENLKLIEKNNKKFESFKNAQISINKALAKFDQGVPEQIEAAVLELKTALEGEIGANYVKLEGLIDAAVLKEAGDVKDLNNAIKAALGESKAYTDDQVSKLATKEAEDVQTLKDLITNALTAADKYTDKKIADLTAKIDDAILDFGQKIADSQTATIGQVKEQVQTKFITLFDGFNGIISKCNTKMNNMMNVINMLCNNNFQNLFMQNKDHDLYLKSLNNMEKLDHVIAEDLSNLDKVVNEDFRIEVPAVQPKKIGDSNSK